ncbi:hypothetical protein QFZ63_005926 [Streptomyces sp. B3I7]|jgi:hypothetical protein|nr:hypothetical protein [Streptomyces sp. B3I8]MDQ0814212.1 hypothetical protein [Streptomyces sp. B3I7]
MSEFALTELDYELRKESVNVVNVERARRKPSSGDKQNPVGRESDSENV